MVNTHCSNVHGRSKPVVVTTLGTVVRAVRIRYIAYKVPAGRGACEGQARRSSPGKESTSSLSTRYASRVGSGRRRRHVRRQGLPAAAAGRLPRPHMVQTKKLMVSRLRAAAKFALTVSVGCAHILKPILDYVAGVSPRSPVLDAAVAVALVALPLTYLTGVVLLYIHLLINPPAAQAAAAPPHPHPQGASSSSRLAAVAWTLGFALLVAVLAFLILAVGLGSSSPSSGGGLTPT